MYNSLDGARSDWEKTLRPLAVVEQTGRTLVVLTNSKDDYHCHRYIQIGEKWDVSVDHQLVNADTVLEWFAKYAEPPYTGHRNEAS